MSNVRQLAESPPPENERSKQVEQYTRLTHDAPLLVDLLFDHAVQCGGSYIFFQNVANMIQRFRCWSQRYGVVRRCSMTDLEKGSDQG